MDLRVLGATEVLSGGQRLVLGGPRQRAVLVDLALHAGRTVLIDQLVDDLWGESPPVSASHTVGAYVSRLRRVLHVAGQEPVLLTTGSGYLLAVDRGDVDALRFGELAALGRDALERDDDPAALELLSAALALWRGPALADIRESAFAPTAARRLDNDRLAALETLVDVRLRLGQHRELVSELETVVSADPFRERFYAQLMLALYRSGRQADSLAVYQQARDLIAAELGLQPGRELRDLQAAILAQAPDLDATGVPRQPLVLTTATKQDIAPVDTADAAERSGAPMARRSPLRARRYATWWIAAVVVLMVGVAGVTALRNRNPAGAAVASVGVSELKTGAPRIARSIALPNDPGSAAAGDGALWVTSPEAQSLYRIDPGSGDRQTIPVGAGAGALAVGGSDVWVANALGGTVSRTGITTADTVQTIAVGPRPTGITIGGGLVWVADEVDSTLSGIDETTGALRVTRNLSVAPFGAAFGAASVWLSNPNADNVTRIDPRGGAAVQIPVGAGPTAITFGLGSLWVANGLDSTVSRIDPATDTVVATIPVGNGPDAITISGHSVWVANRGAATVTRIDADTDTARTAIAIHSSPVALSSVGGHVWVATRAAVSGQPTGGTVRVVQSYPQATIDPALGYPNIIDQFFSPSYDTLVTFAHVGGSGGLEVVPDLALTMPTITGDGTIYSFVLRPGLRYSDGSPVRPEDFRYALERVMQLNPSAAFFLSGIIGARSCALGSSCDLARGITVSDATDSLSFNLTAPDPAFLDELTFRFTTPTPSDVPTRDVGTHPVPSTGPYMISRDVPGREVDFVRNPYFHEWSAAAQPAGSPDRIVWTMGRSPAQDVAAVEAGRADWTDDMVPNPAGLLAQFPNQVHVTPTFAIEYASFNTRVAPFNDVRVRQAFSLAANRAALADQLGGPSAASPTCQILPPGIPGFRRYCPFTVDPSSSGTWVGPDLSAARTLVKRSGTRGMRVTFWNQPDSPPIAHFIVSVLRELGYRASITTPSPTRFAREVNDTRGHVQATDGSWFYDYPNASDLLDQFFRCSAWKPDDAAASRNPSFFCSPALDREMNTADQQQVTNPAQAARTWSAVDRDVTDQAPWVPLVNLTWVDFLSNRVTNYQSNEELGVLLDQLYVRHR